MTDKTGSPERIFVTWPSPNSTGLAFSIQARPPAKRTEYIRADTVSLDFERLRSQGYAPGLYLCFCGDCGKRHAADKRAWRCLECAEKRVDLSRPAPVTAEQAARVLLDEWLEHGEGLLGELSTYSPGGEIDFFEMEADLDGEWVKFSDVEAALHALAQEQGQ